MKCKIIFCSERLGLRKDVLSSLVTKGIDQDQRVEKNVLAKISHTIKMGYIVMPFTLFISLISMSI